MASFASAFREARKRLGAGKTFTWNGKQYSTNLAEEGRSSGRPKRETAPPPRPARTAPTSSPRPKSRPDSTTRLVKAAGAAIDRAERQSSGKRGSGERSPRSTTTVSGASRGVNRPNSTTPAPRGRTGFVLIDEARQRRGSGSKPAKGRIARAIERLRMTPERRSQ